MSPTQPCRAGRCARPHIAVVVLAILVSATLTGQGAASGGHWVPAALPLAEAVSGAALLSRLASTPLPGDSEVQVSQFIRTPSESVCMQSPDVLLATHLSPDRWPMLLSLADAWQGCVPHPQTAQPSNEFALSNFLTQMLVRRRGPRLDAAVQRHPRSIRLLPCSCSASSAACTPLNARTRPCTDTHTMGGSAHRRRAGWRQGRPRRAGALPLQHRPQRRQHVAALHRPAHPHTAHTRHAGRGIRREQCFRGGLPATPGPAVPSLAPAAGRGHTAPCQRTGLQPRAAPRPGNSANRPKPHHTWPNCLHPHDSPDEAQGFRGSPLEGPAPVRVRRKRWTAPGQPAALLAEQPPTRPGKRLGRTQPHSCTCAPEQDCLSHRPAAGTGTIPRPGLPSGICWHRGHRRLVGGRHLRTTNPSPLHLGLRTVRCSALASAAAL